MKKSDLENAVKLFGLSNLMLENVLQQIAKEHEFDLHPSKTEAVIKDEVYYPQFEKDVRKEAGGMAAHYEIFYCLEKSIRKLIVEKMEDAVGPNWWDQKVPPAILDSAQKNQKKERDSGVTPRSSDPIDYTNFGELGEIIKSNWDLFDDIFNSKRAVERVLSTLNVVRGPIAHCSPLADDEIVRLRLAVRDWFRLME